MYYAITVANGIITGRHESAMLMTAETFSASKAFAHHDVISIPENVNITEGLPLASYNNDWTLKPLSQRVAEGLVTVEQGYTLDGEEIRPLTQQERIDYGLDTQPSDESQIEDPYIRIMQLKSNLAGTDYKIIKMYEYTLMGLEVPYDIADIHMARQVIRDEINVLEG